MAYLKAKRNFVAAIVMIFVLANMANAVSFEKIDLTSASDVLNDGTLLYAYNVADATATTINGVTFVANDGLGVTRLDGITATDFYDDGSPGSAIYSDTAGGVADYMELFNSTAYSGSGNTAGRA